MIKRTIRNDRAVLTEEEVKVLEEILKSGDRGGYYMAYHGMTDSREAIVQAKIATFSGNAGGVAFGANRFGQDLLTSGTLINSGLGGLFSTNTSYPGIYYLSQKIAESSFDAVKNSVASGADGGKISDEVFFQSAVKAWETAGVKDYFPGNFLSLANKLTAGFGFSSYEQAEAKWGALLSSPGFWSSAFGILVGGALGKKASDFGSGFTRIGMESPSTFLISGEVGLFVDSAGKVNAVDAFLSEDAAAQVFTIITDFITALAVVLHPKALAVIALAQVVTGQPRLTTAAALPLLQIPLPISDALRRGFIETNTSGFNGDINPLNTNSLTASTIKWKAAGSGDRDVLAASGSSLDLDGGAGDDLLFGNSSANKLIGGTGKDIIWGKAGADTIYGDDEAATETGDDVIHGGDGSDTIHGGKGDDFIDGGDVTVPRTGDVTVLGIKLFKLTPFDGQDTLDYKKLDDKIKLYIRDAAKNAEAFDGDLSKLDGTVGVAEKGEGAAKGVDSFHSIDWIKLLATKENEVRHGSVPDGSKGGAAHNIDFTYDAATGLKKQKLDVVRGAAGEAVSDALLMINGKQLVGASAFDIDAYDMRTLSFLPYISLTTGRLYNNVLTDDRWHQGKVDSAVFALATGAALAGANTVGPVAMPNGIGLGLALFFGILGINEAINWNTRWIDAYDKPYLGVLGERYFVNDKALDQEQTLTISFATATQPSDLVITIDHWKNGDFGIRIVPKDDRAAHKTGTEKDGKLASIADITESTRMAALAADGLIAPPPPPPPAARAFAAFALAASEPGITRFGNAADNDLAGNAGDDLLRGFAGGDTLAGGEGRDTYIFEVGDGADVIEDLSLGGNVIRFHGGIDPDLVRRAEVLGIDGTYDLLVTYGAGDTIRIVGWSLLGRTEQGLWTFDETPAADLNPGTSAATPDRTDTSLEINGTAGADVVDGKDVGEIIQTFAGNDTIRGFGGGDQVLAGDGDDIVDGGGGNDTLRGDGGNDQITGGIGDDQLFGGGGADIFYFSLGDGRDTITEPDFFGFFSGSIDTLVLGEGITPFDIRLSRNADTPRALIMDIGTGGDRITFADFTFDDGIDVVRFANGTTLNRADLDALYWARAVTDGNDDIVSYEFGERLEGGRGDDRMVGLEGNDVFVWNRGDGHDLIIDGGSTAGRLDYLVFGAGITAADVAISSGNFTQNGQTFFQDVLLTIVGVGGGSVRLRDFLNPDASVNRIVFEDGTVWNKDDVYRRALIGRATEGDDHITGTPIGETIDGLGGNDDLNGANGSDTLLGGAGDDYLSGGNGADTLIGGPGDDQFFDPGEGGFLTPLNAATATTYIFSKGFGQDRIASSFFGGNGIAKFTDLNASDFTYSITIFDSIFTSAGEGYVSMLRNGSTDRLYFGNTLAELQFADGETITGRDVYRIAKLSSAGPIPRYATVNSDTFDGTNASERLFLLAGSDISDAGDGDDTVYAGTGNDLVLGGAGIDVIFGENGDDTLQGGRGNDVVIGGQGNDTIAGQEDRDFLFGGLGDDVITGEAGGDVLDGDLGNDRLEGGFGNDMLRGEAGDDILFGGAGNDGITTGTGRDRIVFNRGDGIDWIEPNLVRSAGDERVIVLGEGITRDIIRFSFAFPDWFESAFEVQDNNSPFVTPEPAYQAQGNLETNLVISFANGLGDRIGISGFLGKGMIDRIEFADGSTMGPRDIMEAATGSTAGDDIVRPATAHFNLSNNRNMNVLYGGRGNDTITQTSLYDVIVFGVGDGSDRATASADEVYIWNAKPGDVRLSKGGATGLDLIITMPGAADALTIVDHFRSGTFYVNRIRFEDGTLWSTQEINNRVIAGLATDGNDTIVSTAASTGNTETFDAGGGDDAINGGSGADTYLYNPGDGNDTISDTTAESAVDRLVIGPGIDPADVTIERVVGDIDDVVLVLPTAERIRLVDAVRSTGVGVEQVEFANGTVWNRSYLSSALLALQSSAGNDTITGTNNAETLRGGAGNDTLAGADGGDTYIYNMGDGADTINDTSATGPDVLDFGAGIGPQHLTLSRRTGALNDLVITIAPEVGGGSVTVTNHFAATANGLEQIVFGDGTRWDRTQIAQAALATAGTAGNDTIGGTTSADTLAGGPGNDTLSGGQGADTYKFSLGDGQDTITDGGGVVGQDRIAFGAGITPAMLELSRPVATPNNLVISIRGSTDKITVPNYFAANGALIGAFVFADGTVWDAATIARAANNVSPVLAAPLAAQTATQGSAFELAVPVGTVTDADIGDTITYSARLAGGAPLPAWLSFDGTRFSGTPSNVDVGTLTIELVARDAFADTVATTFTLTVGNINDAPVAAGSLGRSAVAIGGAVAFTVPAAHFSDPDDAATGTTTALTYVATLANGSALPAWLTFDPATRTLSGTAPAGSDGALDIMITASDGTSTATARFGIAVGDANTAPIAANPITAQTATEDAALTFAVPAEAFADATPGDRLEYSATLAGGAPLPSWLSFDTATATFSGTPGQDQLGAVDIEVHATDIFGAQATSQFALTVVNSNDAPIAVGTIGSLGILEDAAFEKLIPVTGLFADIDPGDTLTLTASLAQGQPLPTWLTFDGSKFTGTPDDGDIGFYQVRVTGTDSGNASAFLDYFLFVVPVNDAPSSFATIAPINIDYVTGIDVLLPDVFHDPDDVGLALSARLADGSALPSWLTIDQQGRIKGSTLFNFGMGTTDELRNLDLVVTATDAAGLSTTADVRFVIYQDLGDVITGTDASETLVGTAGSDRIIPGKGNDTIYTGQRLDRVEYFKGDGQDLISRFNPSTPTSSSIANDTRSIIVLGPGIDPEDLVLSRDGLSLEFAPEDYKYNLEIAIDGTTDKIRITQQFDTLFDGFGTVAEVHFADGTIWTEADLVAPFLRATDGGEELVGDGHANTISGLGGRDILVGLDGNDTLGGGTGNDDLLGGTGNDTYVFERGSGSDRIIEAFSKFGIFTTDTLRFGAGITIDDLIVFRDERDPSSFSTPREAGSLLIQLEGSNDSLLIHQQYMTEFGVSAGVDRFEFADGRVLTLKEFDALVFPSGLYEGTRNAETLLGTANAEILVGHEGADTLLGGLGHDIYRWNIGDGNDRLSEFRTNSFDVLEFGFCIDPADILISRPDGADLFGNTFDDLWLTYIPTGERLTIDWAWQVNSSALQPTIEEVRFQDGTIWTHDYMRTYFLQHTDGVDIVRGINDWVDVLDGGAGNDTLRGEGGRDTYIFGRGYGADTVKDDEGFSGGDPSTYRFIGNLTPGDIAIERYWVAPTGAGQLPHDITTFKIRGTSDELILDNDLGSRLFAPSFGFGTFVFEGNGTQWNTEAVKLAYLAQHTSEGADTVVTFGDNRRIETLGGDDTIFVNDFDFVVGGRGGDTYIVNNRFIETTTIADGGLAGEIDTLDLREGQAGFSHVFEMALNGHDLNVRQFEGQDLPIIIREQYTGDGIERFIRPDGTVLLEAEVLALATTAESKLQLRAGTDGADTLAGTTFGAAVKFVGGLGADTLTGNASTADLYVWRKGDGNDTIIDTVQAIYSNIEIDFDVLRLEDATASDVFLSHVGTNLVVLIGSTGEAITVRDQYGTASSGLRPGIEEIVLGDGTLWRRDYIDSHAYISGTDNNDIVNGTSAGDAFLARRGNDTINSTSGSDIFVFRAGDGQDVILETSTSTGEIDQLRFDDLLPADLLFSRVGDNLVITGAGGDSIEVRGQFILSSSFGSARRGDGVEQVKFADGSIWNAETVRQAAWYRGTAGNDSIAGNISFDDTFYGGLGNDTFAGSSRGDFYVFNLGHGTDTISEGNNTDDIDIVRFEAGIAPSDMIVTFADAERDLVLTIGGGSTVVVLDNQTEGAWQGVERVQFADGTTLTRDQLLRLANPATNGNDVLRGDAGNNVINGLDGDDTIRGFGGEDTIAGGRGNDTLIGGNESDTYLFARGDGNDVINDGGTPLTVLDRLRFADDIAPGDVAVTFANANRDIILTITATGDTVTLQDRLVTETAGVDEIVFADGTIWDYVYLYDRTLRAATPTARNDGPFETTLGQSLTFTAATLLANDTDPAGGGTIALVAATAGQGGTVAVVGGDVVFTPTAGYTGPAWFSYRISDGAFASSAIATIKVKGPGYSEAPILTSALPALLGIEDTALDVTVPLGRFVDPDGNPLTFTAAQADGAPLPEWLSFDGASGRLMGQPPADFTGRIALRIDASDGGFVTSGTFALDITPTSDAPVVGTAIPDLQLFDGEFGGIRIPLDAFIDADGDGLQLTARLSNGDPLPPWFEFNPNTGILCADPPVGFTGSLVVTITASDGTASASQDVAITVGHKNEAPEPVNDIGLTATSGVPLIIQAATLLGNDVDPDNGPEPLRIIFAQGASTGTVAMDDAGQVVFTPARGFVGAASFEYLVSDGDRIGRARVNVTVARPTENSAPTVLKPLPDRTSPEDEAFVFALPGATFDDADLNVLTYTATAAGGGALPSWITLNGATGAISGTPPQNYFGATDITLTASDGFATVSDTFKLTITPVNDAPAGVDDLGFTTPVGVAMTFTPAQLLGNDVDVDGDVLRIVGVDPGFGGTAQLRPDGTIVFTPTPEYAGPAMFMYFAADPSGVETTAFVEIAVQAPVNTPPVAVDDVATTARNVPVVIAVTINDADAEGDVLVVTAANAVNGVVTFSGGDLTYTPNADFVGADTISYTISDGKGGEASAFVEVAVQGSGNTGPVAMNDTATTDEDVAVAVAVTVNDTDADGDTLNVIAASALNGAVAFAGGNVTYTPNANYAGADTISYTISDGNGGEASATVAVTVRPINDPPVAANDVASTDEDVAVAVAVTVNDTDTDGDTLNVITASALNGTVAFAGGNLTYTPNADYAGSDTISYTISDGNGGEASATVAVTVRPINDPPVAANDVASTDEDVAVAVAVTVNDTDADGDALNVITASALNGTVAFAGGNLTYTPNADYAGSDTISYTISDGNGGEANATVAVTVRPINDPPVAANDVASTDEDVAVAVAVTVNDTDADGDALNVITASALNGTVAFAGGNLTYTPNADYAGSDTISYTISDGNGGEANATVAVTVRPINDPPVARNDGGLSVEQNMVLLIAPSLLLTNDSDAEGDALSITSVGGATNGTVSIQPNGEVLFTPTAGYSGAASFTYTIADPSGATSTATVSLSVDAGTCTCQIVGTNGDDILDGTNHSDGICGLDGNDLIDGGNSDDCLDGNGGNDTLWGGNGKDDLHGGAGDDQLFGENGNDHLDGGEGDDFVSGGNGVDRLAGEGGDDQLDGGLGPDTFVFAGAFGNDVIIDFTPGRGAVDVLEIDGAPGLNLAAVLAQSQQLAGGTLIDLNPLGLQGTIMLQGVAKVDLNADDFRFV